MVKVDLKKHDPSIYCLQEVYFKYKDVNSLKVKECTNHIPCQNESNENWSNYTNIRQSILHNKEH